MITLHPARSSSLPMQKPPTIASPVLIKTHVVYCLLTLTWLTTACSGQNLAGKKQSINPGINSNFLDPELDVDQWIARFEVESREVYQARKAILSQMKLTGGIRIADVGAGTGFYSILFSKAVGDEGWVYAIDLAPQFVSYLSKQFDQRELNNITTVLCDENSVCLPPNSIDVAFICDVYHHFEFPGETMKSIQRALSDHGRVIVIDFERIPGVTKEWTLNHVRADKATFINEIQDAGFELIAERKIEGFRDNYYLEFGKQASQKR